MDRQGTIDFVGELKASDSSTELIMPEIPEFRIAIGQVARYMRISEFKPQQTQRTYANLLPVSLHAFLA